MKVFISWSGKLSQKIAEELKKWLQQCIQSLDVFCSSEDIEKGEIWNTKLSDELRDTNFGIVCLTKENINAPWIHFEAGALSKMTDSKVATLAINVNITDIKGPLVSFQSTKFEEKDMKKMLLSINSSLDKPLDDSILDTAFNAFWNSFYEKIINILSEYEVDKESEDKKTTKINIYEALEEILQIVRGQSVTISSLQKNNLEAQLLKDFDKSKALENDIDYLFEKIYDFTRYILRCKNNETGRNYIMFIDEYEEFIKQLVRDFPMWRAKFRNMMSFEKMKSYEKKEII